MLLLVRALFPVRRPYVIIGLLSVAANPWEDEATTSRAKCMHRMGYKAAIAAITTNNCKDCGGVCRLLGGFGIVRICLFLLCLAPTALWPPVPHTIPREMFRTLALEIDKADLYIPISKG